MKALQNKKEFNQHIKSINRPFLRDDFVYKQPIKVTFILLENFSMMAFTAAVDTLVTSNLVTTKELFSYQTLSLKKSRSVKNDLNMSVTTDSHIYDALSSLKTLPDIALVCGGFRCSIEEQEDLSRLLKKMSNFKVALGGIWNGAIHLAHANIINEGACAAHIDNHTYIRENFPNLQISEKPHTQYENVFTCAGPRSTLVMLLSIIEQQYGKNIRRAVEEILNSDHVIEQPHPQLEHIGDKSNLPERLRTLIKLMANNIEEPLNLEELSQVVNISRRQIERLFQAYLHTPPGRYYLELRITYARQLIIQSNKSITHIALACGFSSTSHFSTCYKEYFGLSPRKARLQAQQG